MARVILSLCFSLSLVFLLIWSCAEDSSESSDDIAVADAGSDPAGSGTEDSGTDTGGPDLAVGSGELLVTAGSMSSLVGAANAQLASDNLELAIPIEARQALPAGTVGIDTSTVDTTMALTQDEPSALGLASYIFTLADIQLSVDGNEWVVLDLPEGGVNIDIIAGTTPVAAPVPVGTYKYLQFEVDRFQFQRQGCEAITTEKDRLVGVLTTNDEAKRLGQDTPRLFAEFVGDVYWDKLQEIFYYKQSTPLDLVLSPDTVVRHDDFVEPGDIGDLRSPPYAEYQLPTVDNTNENCGKGGVFIDGAYCDDYLGRNTYPAGDGRQFDSYYWALANPIVITEGEQTGLFITVNPTGEVLKPEPCGEAPRDPIFVIGTADQVISYLVTTATTQAAQSGTP